MFGFELWFVYSILSAILGGLNIFMTKVAVERKYDGTVFSTVVSVVSTIILIVTVIVTGDYQWLPWLLVFLVVSNAICYMIGNIVRYEALGYVDTAIFYPLYKTLSPILVIIAGVLFFSETFNHKEIIGLTLSITVPLLLISSKENSRQKNLYRGLQLLVVASLLATVAAATLKLASSYDVSMWLLSAFAHLMMVAVGVGMLLRKKTIIELRTQAATTPDKKYFLLVFLTGICHAFSFLFFMLALEVGTISLVYTIQSLYILIPIVLSIIFYNEHWNTRKVVAIVVSIAALGLLK